jgi:transitional endoplasmic reticulum ATPase
MPHEPASPIDLILADASDETRETLRILRELLGHEPAASLNPTQFAIRQLGVAAGQVASSRYSGPLTSLSVLGRLLQLEIERHAGRVVIGSGGEGAPPAWAELETGSGPPLQVPSRLTVFFPTGTLAEVPLCVHVNDDRWDRGFSLLSAAAAKPVAERVLASFRERLKGPENPLRGRVLEARSDDHGLQITVSTDLLADRAGLVLPERLWAEVDVFLASATDRRELLRSLGLGSNRGLLVAGPPGVGKTHLVRVIAAELAGRYTTILADSRSMRHTIADLYGESDTFGPTLVVLDDIDLVLGHRDGSGFHGPLADFLSTLDGVRKREDILTIATTNDPASLDPAAQRANRFDTVITLPMPDAASRARILERHLAPLGLPIDYAEVAEALHGASGADVKEVIRRTVLEHGESFTLDDMLDVAETGRWQTAVDRGRYLAPPPRRRSRQRR